MSAKPPLIVFGEPHFDESELDLAVATLRSGWIGQGPLVERFERELAEYVGAPHAVAVGSCTAALHLALVALGIGPGDEVITTPFTFVATVNAIEHTGATIVLVDPERDGLNLDADRVAAAVTPRTRAVVPVHFGGRPLDVAAFAQLAERHDLWIVEDAAHAIGAVAAGRRVGGSGHPRVLTCFSFYPNKNLASAEGGAVCLADEAVAQRVTRLRLHGLDVDAWARYASDAYRPSLAGEPGFKCNWTDLQAAIALPQLEKLEGFLAAREYLAERYDELLAGVDGVTTLSRGPGGLHWRHALHLYQVAVDPARRDSTLTALRRDGIGAAVHYIGVNHHPAYRTRLAGDCPNSDWASRALISLPLHLHLAEPELERVAASLARALV